MKVGSYYLITLLESLGKALEQIVASWLSSLAENNSLLLKFQMGARSRRDIITSLDLLIEQIYTIKNYKNQWVASILYLDIVGTFNHISYP